MATNNELNMSSLGNLTPQLQSIVDDLCALLDYGMTGPDCLVMKQRLRTACVDLDIALELDLIDPADAFTSWWCTCLQIVKFKSITTNPDDDTAHDVLDACIQTLVHLVKLVPSCNFMLDDEDVDLPDFSYSAPPSDLTEEGIEPNPGPEYDEPTPRYNRFRGDAKLCTKREARAAKKEFQCYLRLLEQAQANKVKLATLFEDVAQIGGEEIRQIVPPQCDKCKKDPCECMIKKLGVTATTLSIAQSIVKIIDIVTNWINGQEAQVGLNPIPWLLGATPTIDSANELINEATERIQAIPTADEMMQKVSDTVRDVLDSNCGFLPISVRSVLITLATAVGLYIIYKTGRIAYNVVMLPLRYLISSLNHAEALRHVLSYYFVPDVDVRTAPR
jgi:hypothetical protein